MSPLDAEQARRVVLAEARALWRRVWAEQYSTEQADRAYAAYLKRFGV